MELEEIRTLNLVLARDAIYRWYIAPYILESGGRCALPHCGFAGRRFTVLANPTYIVLVIKGVSTAPVGLKSYTSYDFLATLTRFELVIFRVTGGCVYRYTKEPFTDYLLAQSIWNLWPLFPKTSALLLSYTLIYKSKWMGIIIKFNSNNFSFLFYFTLRHSWVGLCSHSTS